MACFPSRSRPDVIGAYELKVGNQTIALVLSPDGHFDETIRFSPGQTQVLSGKWSWVAGRVGFEDLWIPESYAPDHIRRSDIKASRGQPKYTEPGYWSMSAESHLGTILLAVFPDDDVYFVRIGNAGR